LHDRRARLRKAGGCALYTDECRQPLAAFINSYDLLIEPDAASCGLIDMVTDALRASPRIRNRDDIQPGMKQHAARVASVDRRVDPIRWRDDRGNLPARVESILRAARRPQPPTPGQLARLSMSVDESLRR